MSSHVLLAFALPIFNWINCLASGLFIGSGKVFFVVSLEFECYLTIKVIKNRQFYSEENRFPFKRHTTGDHFVMWISHTHLGQIFFVNFKISCRGLWDYQKTVLKGNTIQFFNIRSKRVIDVSLVITYCIPRFNLF